MCSSSSRATRTSVADDQRRPLPRLVRRHRRGRIFGHAVVRGVRGKMNMHTTHRKGLYPRDLPFIGGQEGGGHVVAVSDEASSEGN